MAAQADDRLDALYGAHLEFSLPKEALKRAFAFFLAPTSLRMFWKLFVG